MPTALKAGGKNSFVLVFWEKEDRESQLPHSLGPISS